MDQIIVGATLSLFGLGTLLWLTGELAGRLFGDGSPGAEPSELVGIVLRFATDPSAPAAAWPEGARNVLPGPIAFYFCLMCILALGLVLDLGIRPFVARQQRERAYLDRVTVRVGKGDD